jgi:hypothetical protein
MFVIAHAADFLYIAPLVLIIALLILRRASHRADNRDEHEDKR